MSRTLLGTLLAVVGGALVGLVLGTALAASLR
jgi:hypothetical protein